jgi:hypothetical protein
LIVGLTAGTVCALLGIDFASHIGHEYIVDKVPALRGMCRRETQLDVVDTISASVANTIKAEFARARGEHPKRQQAKKTRVNPVKDIVIEEEIDEEDQAL